MRLSALRYALTRLRIAPTLYELGSEAAEHRAIALPLSSAYLADAELNAGTSLLGSTDPRKSPTTETRQCGVEFRT